MWYTKYWINIVTVELGGFETCHTIPGEEIKI